MRVPTIMQNAISNINFKPIEARTFKHIFPFRQWLPPAILSQITIKNVPICLYGVQCTFNIFRAHYTNFINATQIHTHIYIPRYEPYVPIRCC